VVLVRLAAQYVMPRVVSTNRTKNMIATGLACPMIV